MKRFFALLLAISMVFAFAACGNLNINPVPTNPTEPPVDSTPTDPTPTEPPVETLTPSEGLKFKLNNGGKSYSVEEIGSCADTDIVIPATYNDLPVTAICEQAFWCNNNIISVVIPESVTSIGEQAFAQCDLLVSVAIPDSVKVIGTAAFYLCNSLTEIHIPTSLRSIGASVFWGCSSLTEITIPEGVTSIGTEAFYDCDNLSNITIPVSVKSFGEWSFCWCSNLKYIYYGGTIVQWEEISKGNGWDADADSYTVHYAQN